MREEIRELTETFFLDDESCVFTFDGLALQWRDRIVPVSNFVSIDFIHAGNCCSEKRSKFFRKIPHRCEGQDTMVVRYAESHKKNKLRLRSVKIRGEDKELSHWFRVLRCSLDTAQKERAQEYLVFINPFSGRQNGVEIYMKKVKPLFETANKRTTIVITKCRSDFERVINCGLEMYDAILAVGGDGTVSEIVNSLITSQMEALLPGEGEEEIVVPKIDIPIGIIPCGSTDCVAYTLNGTRDAETNALLAILGNRTCFDVCRAMSKTGANRFFVSVFTYGYLSDLVKESEKFRWMGPIRYNYAGLLTLLRSKEYYGQVDLTGIRFGSRSQVVPLTSKKLLRRSSLSLTQIPIVPIVEPGSEFVETETVCLPKVTNDAAKGDAKKQSKVEGEAATDVVDKDQVIGKPSTSEEVSEGKKAQSGDAGNDATEPAESGETAKPKDSHELVPLATELTPAKGEEIEEEFRICGRYFLIACANISCSSELTPNGIAPNCIPGDGYMNVILFQPNSICDLYKMYAKLTSRDRENLLTELPFISIYQTKRVKISVTQRNLSGRNSANCDGELFHDSTVDIKIHESVIQFYTRRQDGTKSV